MIDTKATPEVDKQFEWLNSAIRRVGNEAQMRVANHLRSVTKGRHFLLPNYHADPLVTLSDKSNLYKRVFNALCALNGKPDWSLLEGQPGQSSPRVDPIEAQPAELPASRPPVVDEAPVKVVQPRTLPPATVSASPKHDELADALAKLLQGRVTAPASGLDEEAVEAIADKCARSAVTEALVEADRGFEGKLKQHLGNGSFPTERVQQLIDAALEGSARRIVLVKPDGETKTIEGLVHKQFDIILKMTRCRTGNGHPVPLWLDGPPGGGKSHLMEQIAEALGLDPYILAIGPTDTKTVIIGSIATGEFKPGIAYLPYKNGGLLGIDEIAAGDPGVLVSINSLVANGTYRFPNGELIKKHKDFHVIAADNTRGHGNAKGMIRNRLDAATLDRFAFLKVEYDNKLEAALCGNASWAAYVKKVRDYIASNSSESVYITPRASINGAALLAGGVDVETVLNSTVFKFTSADLKNTIISNIGTYKP
jgi:cobaltochelatase CobS